MRQSALRKWDLRKVHGIKAISRFAIAITASPHMSDFKFRSEMDTILLRAKFNIVDMHACKRMVHESRLHGSGGIYSPEFREVETFICA